MYTILSYVGLGSAGLISSLYLLWSRSRVQADLNTANGDLASYKDQVARALSELAETQKTFQDQLARRDAEISTLNAQKAQLLDAIQKSNVPGELRNALRVSLGINPANP
jgi:F0F1-type ATP synthase delta subunit